MYSLLKNTPSSENSRERSYFNLPTAYKNYQNFHQGRGGGGIWRCLGGRGLTTLTTGRGAGLTTLTS